MPFSTTISLQEIFPRYFS